MLPKTKLSRSRRCFGDGWHHRTLWLPGPVSSWTRCCLNFQAFSFPLLLPIELQNVSHHCQSLGEKIPFVTVTWFTLRPLWAWSLEGFLLKARRRILMWSTHLLSVTSLRDYNRHHSPTPPNPHAWINDYNGSQMLAMRNPLCALEDMWKEIMICSNFFLPLLTFL